MKFIFDGPLTAARQLMPCYGLTNEIRRLLDAVEEQLPWQTAVYFMGEMPLSPTLARYDHDLWAQVSVDPKGREWWIVLWGPTILGCKDTEMSTIFASLINAQSPIMIDRDIPFHSCVVARAPIASTVFRHQPRLTYTQMRLRVAPDVNDPDDDVAILHTMFFGDMLVHNVRVDEVHNHGRGFWFAGSLRQEFRRFRIVYMSVIRTELYQEGLIELHAGWRGAGDGSFRYATNRDFELDKKLSKIT